MRNVEIWAVLSSNEVDLLMLKKRVFLAKKRSEMCSAVMKGLWYPYTQESCFDAWKRSHIGCSSFLCGRFADSEESRFQASKSSNIGSAVLESGRCANIH